jgi:hypothetical protein
MASEAWKESMRRFGFLFVLLLAVLASGCDTRHKATVYKLKNHHIVMKDDNGKWWEYILKNGTDIDFDVPYNDRGEMVLPSGGDWRPATQQEEEEVTVEGEATNAEETSVDENDAGAPDGAGDVGGDSGGDSGGGDGGGGGDE